MKKTIICALTASLLLGSCGKKERPGGQGARPVSESVQRRDLKDIISNSGSLVPVIRVELKSEASGRIDTVFVKEGTRMKKGQPILRIDPERIQTRREKLDLRLRQNQIRAAQAKRDYENAARLVKFGKTSPNRLEDLKNQLELKEIEVAQIKLEIRDVDKEMRNTIIRAPMDGVLTDLLVEEGEIVAAATGGFSAGTSIGTFVDINKLEVETDVGEVDYAKLRLDMPVDVSMASNPQKVTTGKISFISLSAKKLQGSMVSTFKVRVALDSLLTGMVPGVNVNVDMVLLEKRNVLAVPYSMVISRKKGNRVLYMIRKKGSERPVPIRVGVTDFKYYEVLDGLKEGETVVKPARAKKMVRRRK